MLRYLKEKIITGLILFLFPSLVAAFDGLAMSEVEGDPSAIVAGCVNVVSGTFIDSDCDLIIPGAQEVSFKRFYSSSDWKGGCLSDGWNHNYPLDGHLGWNNSLQFIAVLPEASGGMRYYDSHKKIKIYGDEVKPPKNGLFFGALDIVKDVGITNTAGGDIGGYSHIRNQTVNYFTGPRRLVVNSCDGGTRTFHSTTWALPYTLKLVKDAQPNGNQIIYNYDERNELKRISVKDVTGERTYGWLEIGPMHFNGKHHCRIVTSSDGRKLTYEMHNSKAKWERSKDTKRYVYRVTRPNGPQVLYDYCPPDKNGNEKIIKKTLPRGFLEIEYYKLGFNWVGDEGAKVKDWDKCPHHVESVKLLKAPVGTDTTPIITHRFFYSFNYDKRHRSEYLTGSFVNVRDALNHQTTYHLLQGRRLGAIERFTGNSKEHYKRYSVDRLYWGKPQNLQHCNLICRALEEADGSVRSCRYLKYDQFHNVVSESIYGNLTGNNPVPPSLNAEGIPLENGCERCVVKRTYYKNKFHLKETETAPNRCVTRFEYLPETNLCTSKLVCNGLHVVSREFFLYDRHHVLRETITDNGSGSTLNDLRNVSVRKITRFVSSEGVAIGLPAAVHDYYWDPETNQECLLGYKNNVYSGEGRLIRQLVYDSNACHRYTLSWEYDHMGNVISEIDAGGRCIERRYDEVGNKTFEKVLGASHHTEFVYDFVNRLVAEKVRCDNGEVFCQTFTYDYCGNRTSSTDYLGNTVHYEYDDFNRLIKTIYPPCQGHDDSIVQHEMSQRYDIAGNIISITDVNGNTTSTDFNIRGQPVKICHPDGTIERFEYYLDGALKKKTAPNGTATHYHRDVLNNVIRQEVFSQSGELLSTTSATFHGIFMLSETDANGNVIRYTYDGAGRLKSIVRPDTTTRYEYDSLGRKIKTIDGITADSMRVIVQEYDLLNRVVEERLEDELGFVHTRLLNEYDLFGRKCAVTTYCEEGAMTTRTYFDDLGRTIKVVDPLGYETITHYDNQSCQTITVTDALGKQTITRNDALGRIFESKQKDCYGVDLSVSYFKYDGKGKPTSRIDIVKANGQPDRNVALNWSYDALGRLICLIEAAGTVQERHTFIDYDIYGQKEYERFVDGSWIRYQYDSQGRLKLQTSSDDSVSYQFSYDANGNVIKVDDLINHCVTLRAYDSSNRLVNETLANGLHMHFKYDGISRITEQTLPDGSSVRYDYNCAFMSAVTRANACGEELYTHRYLEYDLFGHVLKSQLIQNAGEQVFQRDIKGRIIYNRSEHFEEYVPNEGYDAMGNLLHLVRRDEIGEKECNYRYDPLYQLAKEEGVAKHDYLYDSLHNRLAKDTQLCQVDNLNQLLYQGDTKYSYDARGCRVHQQHGEHHQNYHYDILGRLTEVLSQNERYTYLYDSFNRRIAKTAFQLTKKGDWTPVACERYLYQEQMELGAVDEEGKVFQFRALGQGLGAEIGAAVALELHQQLYAPIHDHNGNLVTLINAQTGKVAEVYRYSAFGEEERYEPGYFWGWSRCTGTCDNPWRFASKRHDCETGFVNFGRRYYDPESGRWTTTDPRGFDDGPNLYAYVHNNPLIHFDLYGLKSQSAPKQWYEPSQTFRSDPERSATRSWATMARHWVGDAVAAIGRDLFMGPMRRMAVGVGRWLGGYGYSTPLGFDTPSCQKCWTGGNEPPSQTQITFINGQGNLSPDAEDASRLIGSHCNDCNVNQEYNQSHGILADLIKSAMYKLGWKTRSAAIAEAHILNLIEKVGGTGSNGRVIIVAHSQGGLVLGEVLENLNKGQKNMLDVITLGTAKIINDKQLRSSMNLISSRDLVSIGANPIDLPRALLTNDPSVRILKSCSSSIVDHAFASPTYQGGLKDELKAVLSR